MSNYYNAARWAVVRSAYQLVLPDSHCLAKSDRSATITTDSTAPKFGDIARLKIMYICSMLFSSDFC